MSFCSEYGEIKQATNIMMLIGKDSLFLFLLYLKAHVAAKISQEVCTRRRGFKFNFLPSILGTLRTAEKKPLKVTHDNRYLTNYTCEEELKLSQTLSLSLFLTMPNIWCR